LFAFCWRRGRIYVKIKRLKDEERPFKVEIDDAGLRRLMDGTACF
jgi:hypothetical protein